MTQEVISPKFGDDIPEPNYEQNRWQIFTSIVGWERVSAALDTAYEAIELKLIKAIKEAGNNTENVINVVERARRTMENVMLAFSFFGAYDSEPHGVLASRLEKTLHKNGWGGAEVNRNATHLD